MLCHPAGTVRHTDGATMLVEGRRFRLRRWLVEIVNAALEVHVYQLDEVTESYAPVGLYRDRLELPPPFPMDIDLTELRRM